MRALLLLLLVASASEAKKPSKAKKPDPRIAHLGRSCAKPSDCASKAQTCLKTADMNGKPLPRGFCVLPCAPLDAGTQPVEPGPPVDAKTTQKILKKKPPPRCPQRYQCHGADVSTPIDLCVKD
jgi:hypothetical protein